MTVAAALLAAAATVSGANQAALKPILSYWQGAIDTGHPQVDR